MDKPSADQAIERLLDPAAASPFEPRWKDPQTVATVEWRDGALDPIVDPQVGSSGTILVELDLNHDHPHFYGIVRIDDRGIWYSDGDGSVKDPAWRLRVLPWGHVDGITLHQAS